jgi:MFS family permease
LNSEPKPSVTAASSALSFPLFRRMWTGSLLFNLGIMTLGVSSGWAMTQMASSPSIVVLVQTSLMIPIMLFAIPAGAIADMFDRRLVALCALGISVSSAAALTTFSLFGLLTPPLLLVLIFFVGCGLALSGPSSQAAIAEQVPSAYLASAIAMNLIALNLARSFGPAVGGFLVAATGATTGFAIVTISFIPMLLAYLTWKRAPVVSRLPPERIGRAMVSGIRYIGHSPPVRSVLIRMMIGGLAFGSQNALMPLTSRELLGGGAGTYGLLLGAFGIGAVLGALATGRLRARFSTQTMVAGCSVISGATMIGLGLSHNLLLSFVILAIGGASWTTLTSSLNITIQLSAPRWVAGRCLAGFSAAQAGSMGIGAFIWGRVATAEGVSAAMILSGTALMLTVLVGAIVRAPTVDDAAGVDASELRPEPELRLALTPRSGPIIVEVRYRVPLDRARTFYRDLQKVERARHRNGGYNWSIARDAAEPEIWVERFQCPTWLDYLHQRSRTTVDDRALDTALNPYRTDIRRYLERPFGSVRWKDDAPDPSGAGIDQSGMGARSTVLFPGG